MSRYRGIHRPGRRRDGTHTATAETARAIRARLEQTAALDTAALARLLARPRRRHAAPDLLDMGRQ